MYYSQYNQDKILNERYFNNKRNGTFVDIGAHDGITLSNTYFYESELGWDGVCIEPIPSVFVQLKENRNCKLIHGCAWSEDTKKKFRIIDGYSEMLSGLVDQYSIDHLNRVDEEIRDHDQTVIDVDMDCYDVNKLFREHGLNQIDFINLDVEGGEFDILSHLNYDEFDIKVILVENNYRNSNMRYFMIENGYSLDATINVDDVYVKM